MTYKEVKKDLFDVPSKYCFAHCINGSYNLGAGIAKTFRDRLFMQSKLRSMYPIEDWDKVSTMIKEVFSDLDINILVCYL